MEEHNGKLDKAKEAREQKETGKKEIDKYNRREMEYKIILDI